MAQNIWFPLTRGSLRDIQPKSLVVPSLMNLGWLLPSPTASIFIYNVEIINAAISFETDEEECFRIVRTKSKGHLSWHIINTK